RSSPGSSFYLGFGGILRFSRACAPVTAYSMAKTQPPLPYLLAVTLHILNNLSAIHGLLWLIAGYPILLTTFSIAWYLNGKTSPTDFPINT
ncbi:MAG: hypothetical protein NWE75_02460, partial [Candidatus Bathyarchaeota archaeon]|nr:hypothetical protein [Candidatus Bathyarchaeota archaeon]